MFDAMKLLGAMLENRPAPSTAARLDNASQQTSRGGILQGFLAQLAGAGGQGGGLGTLLRGMGGDLGGPGAFDKVRDMARRAMESPGGELQRNNPAAVGGLGAIAGALLGGGRGAVGGGLLAVLGSLAFDAMQQAKPGSAAPAKVSGLAGMPGYRDPADVNRKAMLLLRAIIQAAKADGQIDAAEMDRIMGRLSDDGEDQEARDYVLQQLRGAPDIDGLAREVQSPQEAAEVYAASLTAMEAVSPEERNYLSRLAFALKLQPEVVNRIHQSMGLNA